MTITCLVFGDRRQKEIKITIKIKRENEGKWAAV